MKRVLLSLSFSTKKIMDHEKKMIKIFKMNKKWSTIWKELHIIIKLLFQLVEIISEREKFPTVWWRVKMDCHLESKESTLLLLSTIDRIKISRINKEKWESWLRMTLMKENKSKLFRTKSFKGLIILQGRSDQLLTKVNINLSVLHIFHNFLLIFLCFLCGRLYIWINQENFPSDNSLSNIWSP